MSRVRVAIGPTWADWAERAVLAGGGIPVPMGEPADGLIWLSPGDVDGLGHELAGRTGPAWVQLPFAGVERFLDAGLLDAGRRWTCAKGCYAEPVAEHALLLALAGLRDLPRRVRAGRWEEPGGTSLFDEEVTILGGGGITQALISLLSPFRARITVVRRRPGPLPGATRTMAIADLHEALTGALVVFLALALTPTTAGIIGAAELEAMDRRAWLVNVARGGHVDTDALVTALEAGEIAGAALDVTDPEPLPDGHPLWAAPRCIVTPHTADTWAMIKPRLAARISENVARYGAGDPLIGEVDVDAGY